MRTFSNSIILRKSSMVDITYANKRKRSAFQNRFNPSTKDLPEYLDEEETSECLALIAYDHPHEYNVSAQNAFKLLRRLREPPTLTWLLTTGVRKVFAVLLILSAQFWNDDDHFTSGLYQTIGRFLSLSPKQTTDLTIRTCQQLGWRINAFETSTNERLYK